MTILLTYSLLGFCLEYKWKVKNQEVVKKFTFISIRKGRKRTGGYVGLKGLYLKRSTEIKLGVIFIHIIAQRLVNVCSILTKCFKTRINNNFLQKAFWGKHENC